MFIFLSEKQGRNQEASLPPAGSAFKSPQQPERSQDKTRSPGNQLPSLKPLPPRVHFGEAPSRPLSAIFFRETRFVNSGLKTPYIL